jgi:hypothetical protein
MTNLYLQNADFWLEIENPLGMDAVMSDEYSSQCKLLQEFTNVPSIDNAWVFKTNSGTNVDLWIYS